MYQRRAQGNGSQGFQAPQDNNGDGHGAGGDSGANLIINYLPQSLRDEEFHEIFSQIGPIKNSKIIRDKNTGYSYGFGFIEYNTPELAARAIENLNGLKLQHKTLKVAYARPPGENSRGTKLYIENIPKHFIEKDVQDAFAQFGDVIQCKLLADKNGGGSRGVGFVLFENKLQAQKAIDNMNGQVLEPGAQALKIKFAEENAKQVRPPPGLIHTPPGGRGFYGGPVRNQPNHYPNRYNPMMGNFAEDDFSGFQSSNVGKRDEFVSYPPPGSNRYPSASSGRQGGPAPVVGPSEGGGYVLYVNNLGPYVEDGTVWSLFSHYGPVMRVDIMRDKEKDNQCKNFGFVTMSNYDDAANAIVSLNGIYNLINKPLHVAFKTPKGN